MEIDTRVDARVVKTVRRLKSTKHTADSVPHKTKVNQPDTPSTVDDILIQRHMNKKGSCTSSTAKSTKDTIDQLNNNLAKQKSLDNNSKISIDGAALVKPLSNMSLPQPKQHQPYNYYNLKRIIKNKTEYQKNILSENNIEKYKKECFNIIKGDTEIMNLLKGRGIIKKEDIENYINTNFFAHEHFLFKLEILILNDINESNTLKVFSTVKKRLPFKTIKENFYKEEVRRSLKKKNYDVIFEAKLKTFMNNIDNHIKNIKNFDV